MTSFICPACQRSAFFSHAPIFDYAPRRWALWLPPRKRWIGDLVRCANPACLTVALAGLSGVIKLEGPLAASAPPVSPISDGPAPPPRPRPEPREVSQVPDRDMRWR